MIVESKLDLVIWLYCTYNVEGLQVVKWITMMT